MYADFMKVVSLEISDEDIKEYGERKRQKKIWYKIKRRLKKVLKRERGTNEDI